MTFYPNLKQISLSHSSQERLRSCARKFEFTKILQRPRGDDDDNFTGDVGKALHAGYQNFLVNGDREQAIFAMMEKYPYYANVEGSKPRSLEACYPTMQALMDHANLRSYEIATIYTPDGNIRDAIEVPFQLNIKGFTIDENKPIKIIYVGYIDAILFDVIAQTYIVVDLKTHRDNMDDLTAKYAYHEQVIPYGLVLQRFISEKVEAFDAAYISCFIDIEKPKVAVYKFPKTMEDIQDWARGLYIDLTDIKRYYNLGWWRRNGSACMTYRKVCPFFDECQIADPKLRQAMLLPDPDNVEEEKPFGAWVEIDLELAA